MFYLKKSLIREELILGSCFIMSFNSNSLCCNNFNVIKKGIYYFIFKVKINYI